MSILRGKKEDEDRIKGGNSTVTKKKKKKGPIKSGKTQEKKDGERGLSEKEGGTAQVPAGKSRL